MLFIAEVLLELGLVMHRLNYTLGGRQDRPLIRLIVIISSPDLIRRRTERIDRQNMVDNMICAAVKAILGFNCSVGIRTPTRRLTMKSALVEEHMVLLQILLQHLTCCARRVLLQFDVENARVGRRQLNLPCRSHR